MTDLAYWVAIWLAAAAFVVLRHWRVHRGVGLVLGYVVSFGALHWLASSFNLLPWNRHRAEDLVTLGMRESALAMVMFAAGAEIVLQLRRARTGSANVTSDEGIAINHGAVNFYLVAGVALHVVLLPIARGLPSVTALVSTGSTLMVTALGLKCWNAWHERRSLAMLGWLFVSALLPFFTVATQGYLGYGLAGMLMVLVFLAAFYGPRLKLLAIAVLFAYTGLSVYVTYMRDRAYIRSVVWSGSSLDDRLASVVDSVSQFEWFQIQDPRHLARVGIRLDQNFLVGSAVARVDAQQATLAHGATMIEAVYALLPRALWPEKAIVAGSGDLVSTYTGFRFSADTSVGVGQVLECYVNFGTAGVLVSFMILGALTAAADGRALRALAGGDIRRFTMWYVPAIALLNVGGSFVEATSTAAAGLVMAALVGGLTVRLYVPRPMLGEAGAPEPVRGAQ
ncbi:MAG: hypothetical protein IT184_02920 [Acidobacteria bacterium]|nr:hypothetical protein [Acidobacteriota bacterium]